MHVYVNKPNQIYTCSDTTIIVRTDNCNNIKLNQKKHVINISCNINSVTSDNFRIKLFKALTNIVHKNCCKVAVNIRFQNRKAAYVVQNILIDALEFQKVSKVYICYGTA